MSRCENISVVNVGDEFYIIVYHNTYGYALMTNSNVTLSPIIDVPLIYVAPRNTTSSNSITSAAIEIET
jgi:hypothetical protein